MMEAVINFVNGGEMHHILDPILFLVIVILFLRKRHYKKLYKQTNSQQNSN